MRKYARPKPAAKTELSQQLHEVSPRCLSLPTRLRPFSIDRKVTMRRLLPLVLLVVLAAETRAASTINATNSYAWGANIGWTNWLPSAADGVVIGEYVCSGYIWAANVGWINFGNGSPVNNIQYQNNAANDFGVNYSIDPTQPGVAILRGFAYGANIGWINFESTGNPRVSLFTGTFSGYAYSANCGWINLNDINGKVQTDHVLMGADTDGDGIADAFEYQNWGNLTTANGTSDADQDGVSDKEEYLDGTSPLIATDRLRITAFGTNADGTSSPITWTSNTARLYVIETKTDILAASWSPDPTFGTPFAPDPGTVTTRTATGATAIKRFYHVIAIRPLP